MLKVKYLFTLLNIVIVLNCFSQSKENLSKTKFIDSLVNIMTLEEKIGQLSLFTSDWDKTGPSLREGYINDIRIGKAGAIFNAYTADYTRKLQKIAVEETRLHIPLIFGYDVIHGHRTIFPIPLGESCSWDLNLIEKSARIAATEATAEGLNWTFAPMVDIARDPRWGRVAEGAGEDTWLGSLIAKSRVKGFQGENLEATNTLAACAKHYAAYGAAQGGRDYNIVDISDYSLHNTYLPPFAACVEAGVASFMTAFNELNGIPCTANNYLLDDILRKKWGFKGFVVTDYTSINEMVPHGYALDEEDAAFKSIKAGVDMDMQGATYYNYLSKLIKEKRISINTLDTSVKRVLSIKYDLGLFKDPYKYSDNKREKELSFTEANLQSAKLIAEKSIVLLKNESNILPIKPGTKIALIGPLAADKRNLIGNWSAAGDWTKARSVLESLKELTRETNEIQYAKACNLLEDKALIKKLNDNGGNIETDVKSTDVLLQEAIEISQKADVIIAVMGEAQGMSGEAASRSNIDLPENQKKILKALKKLGKPIILVLMNGRPLTLEWENENMDAILETWFSGTMAGDAISSILTGKTNPSGKLTISFPRNTGQIPVYYNSKNTGRPFDQNNKYTSKYLDTENTPLYPFGYGLSYSNFEYSTPTISKSQMTVKDSVTIYLNVKNKGPYGGEEIVQLYIKDINASITRPLKELKNFEKIYLNSGESKVVKFILKGEDFSFLDRNLQKIVEPGMFKIMVGKNSRDVESLDFKITE